MARITCPHDHYKTMIPPNNNNNNNNPTPQLEIRLIHQVFERLFFRHVPGFDQPLATDYHRSGPMTESTPFDPFCHICQNEVAAFFRSFGLTDESSYHSLHHLQQDVETLLCNGVFDEHSVFFWRVDTHVNRPYDDYDEDVVRAWAEWVSFEEASEARACVSATEEAVDALKRSIIDNNGDETSSCTICLEEMNNNNDNKDGITKFKIEMPCKHEFHEGCILEWLKTSHVCPLCRFELPSSSVKDCNS